MRPVRRECYQKCPAGLKDGGTSTNLNGLTHSERKEAGLVGRGRN